MQPNWRRARPAAAPSAGWRVALAAGAGLMNLEGETKSWARVSESSGVRDTLKLAQGPCVGRPREGAALCYAVLCCAMLCYAMLCYAMSSRGRGSRLCNAMLCYGPRLPYHQPEPLGVPVPAARLDLHVLAHGVEAQRLQRAQIADERVVRRSRVRAIRPEPLRRWHADRSGEAVRRRRNWSGPPGRASRGRRRTRR